MASPSTMCGSCLRAVRQVASKSRSSERRLISNTAQVFRTPPYASQQSLYLDFLAPSVRATHIRPAIPNIRRVPSIPHATKLSRGFATASATADPTTQPQPPSQRLARAILHPRSDSNGNPMLISLSPRAADRLSKIAATDKNPELALRVTVESGGCHGFQYLMDLVDLSKKPAADDDTVFEGDKGAKVVIDEASLELLQGSTVDYTMELIGSQFKVTGIPGATSSCGCGTSFDIKI